MKTLIVYYSLNGNTELTAKQAADAMGAELLKIEPKKNYPDKGFRKFLVGGGDVVAKRRPELEPYSFNPEEFDRIIIASPVWASSPAPAVMTFIEENRDKLMGKRLASIFCNAGGGSEKAAERLKKAIGAESFEAELSLIDPKTRPSEENGALFSAFIEKLT